MRLKKYLEETTTTPDVEKNLAKGHVDVIGAPKYKKKKKKTKLDRRGYNVHETSISGDVVGSGQTRVTGAYDNQIVVLKRQPRPLKFSKLLGAYLPPEEEEMEEAERKVPKEFMDDPLYKKVLKAKNKKEFEEALDTLKKIRGSGAVEALKKSIKNKV